MQIENRNREQIAEFRDSVFTGLLPIAHCPLPTVHRSLFRLQFAICNLQFAICNLSYAAGLLLLCLLVLRRLHGARWNCPSRIEAIRSPSARMRPIGGHPGLMTFGCSRATAASNRAILTRDAARLCCGSSGPTAMNGPESKIIAYLEGDVELARNGPSAPAKVKDKTWLGRFTTNREIQVYAGQVAGEPTAMPPIYQRAMERRNPISADTVTRSEVRPAQFAAHGSVSRRSFRRRRLSRCNRDCGICGYGGFAYFPAATCHIRPNGSPIRAAGICGSRVINGGVNMVIDSRKGRWDRSTFPPTGWSSGPLIP